MGKKKRSLKLRLTLLSAIPVLAACLILVFVYVSVSYGRYMAMYQSEGLAVSKSYASSVDYTITTLGKQFDVVSKNPDVVNEALTIDERKAILKDTASTSLFKDFAIAYSTGKTYNDTDISAREYFQQAMATKNAYISSPVLRMTDNSITIMMGKYFTANGKEYVVYGGLDANTFSDLISDVHYEENGIAFIMDKTGVVVGTSTQLVPQLTTLAGEHTLGDSITSAVSTILKGKEGNVSFKLSGTAYTAAYAQISNVEGWYIVTATPTQPIISSIVNTALMIVIVAILSTLTAIVVTGMRIKNIAGPVAATAQRMQDMAAGDISTPAQVFKTNDEIENMSEAADTLISNMNAIINDLATVLDSVSHGDLTAKPAVPYPGDFSRIKDSIDRILSSLNQIMTGVNVSSTDVLTGSVQIAEGSQSLAEGTTRQASAIEEISATIQDVSTQIATTADNASQAGQLSEKTQEKVNYQDNEIQNMVSAMDEINDTSKEIEKIIKTIEDIAFQTNILALNAAVEAARAGSAGKGFAVVADEVRNLANKSQEAAKSTSNLINAAIAAVSKGSEIAAATAESMKEVKDMSAQTAKIIVDIASASQEQSDSIKQITAGVEQISQVIQTNAATAEETSALCSSLNGQSKQLQDQVAHFKTNA